MNCWVCGGHGHVIKEEDAAKMRQLESEAFREKRVPQDITVCHYCAGSGFIDIEE